MSAAWAKTALLTAAALLSPACEGNLEAVRKEETRYQQEFPGRELPVVALETLEGARQLVPSSRERAYALDGRVGVEGDYYIFTVFTPHGSYTVKGAFALAEACREARIVEMFLCSPYSVRMQKAMGDFWSPAKGPRGTMFVSPVDSIRGLGRSFHFQFQEWENNYASASKNDSRALDGINRAGFNAGAAERVFAYHLRADAYSENPAFQALLRALASDREMADALLPAPRRFFVPCGGLNGLTPEDYVPAWGDRWPAPGGKSAQAERFLRDESGAGVPRVLRQFYLDNFGEEVAGGAALRRLLANHSYSPRQQTYIAWYLAQVKARNSEEALNYLGMARTAFRAAYNLAQLETLHAIHSYYAPVERFVALQNQLGVLTRGRQLVVTPLWDHTRDRSNVRHLLMEIRNFGDNYGLRDLQLWFTGDCDRHVVEAGQENGITVRANVAANEMFRFTSLRAVSYRPQPSDPALQDTATVQRDPAIFQERTARPLPVHEVKPKAPGDGGIEIEPDRPGWNGRLTIEKPLDGAPPPPPARRHGHGAKKAAKNPAPR